MTMRNSAWRIKRVTAVVFVCIVAYAAKSLASAPDSTKLPAPPMQQAQLTVAQIKSIENSVKVAKDLGTLVKLEKQIAIDKTSCAMNLATAKHLIEQILDKQKQLVGPKTIEIAHTLSDLADCYPLEQMKDAIPFRQEALAIASKKLPERDPFVLRIRSTLALQMVLTHTPRLQIVAVCPACPHCHINALVVPVVGLMPFSPEDYAYGFVNGNCSPNRPDWYCRKCKGTFFPYSTKEMIVDGKPN